MNILSKIIFTFIFLEKIKELEIELENCHSKIHDLKQTELEEKLKYKVAECTRIDETLSNFVKNLKEKQHFEKSRTHFEVEELKKKLESKDLEIKNLLNKLKKQEDS
jgi:hypothetical protein